MPAFFKSNHFGEDFEETICIIRGLRLIFRTPVSSPEYFEMQENRGNAEKQKSPKKSHMKMPKTQYYWDSVGWTKAKFVY